VSGSDGQFDGQLRITSNIGWTTRLAPDTVTITANVAASGKAFDKWTTSNGGVFANANAATTTFTMPANATTVAATYKDNGGGGGGGGGGAPSLLYLAAALALFTFRRMTKRQ